MQSISHTIYVQPYENKNNKQKLCWAARLGLNSLWIWQLPALTSYLCKYQCQNFTLKLCKITHSMTCNIIYFRIVKVLSSPQIVLSCWHLTAEFQANLVLAIFLFFPAKEVWLCTKETASYVMDGSRECQSVTIEKSHYANCPYAN